MTGKIGPFLRRSRYVENGSTRIGTRFISSILSLNPLVCACDDAGEFGTVLALTFFRFGTYRTVMLAECPAGTVECRMAAANMVEVAALVGDTTRATILAALMSGQALTGSELASLARISRPTASEHLTKLVNARLLAVTKSVAITIIASPRRWLPGCWKASRPSLPLKFRRAISRIRRKMLDCASPAPATIIWLAGLGWLSPMCLLPRDTSSSMRMVAR